MWLGGSWAFFALEMGSFYIVQASLELVAQTRRLLLEGGEADSLLSAPNSSLLYRQSRFLGFGKGRL